RETAAEKSGHVWLRDQRQHLVLCEEWNSPPESRARDDGGGCNGRFYLEPICGMNLFDLSALMVFNLKMKLQ
ncbi:hypothetical protein J6590_100969, partial [Homalodisca vitripennis]